jgi:SAM-dependent methyltransferase
MARGGDWYGSAAMSDRPGLAWRVAWRLRSSPRLYGAARRAYTAVNGRLPPVRVEGVPGPVHRNDLMIDRASALGRSTYAAGGRQVVELLEAALADAGGALEDAEVLDFGCGHGRVVRHLVGRARRVAACDLDHEGVRFCAEALGADPVPGDADLSRVPLGDYDAIWLGSVVTHHRPPVVAALLQHLAAHLRPGGVLVASSADERTLEADLQGAGRGWLQGEEDRIRAALASDGAAYVPYPHERDGAYGLGYQLEGWLDAAVGAAGLRRLWHRPGAWSGQAVGAWTRPR